MKKILLFAIAGFFFAANSNAQVKREVPQSQQTQSDSSHHKRGMMMDQLNLTPDQKSQMKTLHENMKQQREAITNDASLTADQKKEKMKELHKSQSDKVNAILTPGQQEKMKELRKERMKNHKMNHNVQQGEAS